MSGSRRSTDTLQHASASRSDGAGAINRRQALTRITALCGIPLLGSAAAGFRPATLMACDGVRGKTIRWLVGYSAGGGYDAYARLIEPVLERLLDARIVVHNLPGAGGLVAARTLANASADGRTLGIVDGPGLLLSRQRQVAGAPDLEEELIPLGRIARLHPLLVTAGHNGLLAIDDLLARARLRPLVFGITAMFSQNFVNSAVLADLFGFDARFVAGFPGSREVVLALVRGDVDCAVSDAESMRIDVESGRLTPLLQIARTPFELYESVAGVPHLTGDDGITARRPELSVSAQPGFRETAEALVDFSSLGRLLAAPAGLPHPLILCLEQSLLAALADPEFRTAARRANRSYAAASGPEVRDEIKAAVAAITRLLPLVEEAARRAG